MASQTASRWALSEERRPEISMSRITSSWVQIVVQICFRPEIKEGEEQKNEEIVHIRADAKLGEGSSSPDVQPVVQQKDQIFLWFCDGRGYNPDDEAIKTQYQGKLLVNIINPVTQDVLFREYRGSSDGKAALDEAEHHARELSAMLMRALNIRVVGVGENPDQTATIRVDGPQGTEDTQVEEAVGVTEGAL